MIAGREANFKRVLDSKESCLHLVAERKAEVRHRTIESEEVTLPDSDRGDRCFEKDIKSATLGAELGIALSDLGSCCNPIGHCNSAHLMDASKYDF
ncbi:hypothetical protein TNCV_4357621 [Trichonephila clavipes]|nr:hypothetical protein TNCV_4357621 [Trichonephila clavipes]